MFEHSPLLEKVYRHSLEMPDKTALLCGEHRESYGELFRNVRRAAFFLSGNGLSKGDAIALSARKEVGFVHVYLAAHMLGVVNAVVDAESGQERLDYILDVVKPKLQFGFRHGPVPSVDYSEILSAGIVEEEGFPSGLAVGDVADIMFTTGTTGRPKGVKLTHWNIHASARNINRYVGNNASDVEVLGLPLCHSFGLGRLRCVLEAGGTMVLLGNFANVKLLFDTMEKCHVTGLGMVPAMWAYIRKFSGTRISRYNGQVRYVEIGSASMPEESKRELLSLFPSTRICMHYGLTEASRALFMEFHECRKNLRTVGKPVSASVDVRVMDERGNVLQDNEAGELCVKGDMVTPGYLLERDNKDSFWGDYFRTGDVGYRDGEGYYYLVGREKELINVGGKKVSPVEVEEAVCRAGAKDCVCVGVADPCGILGEVPKVYVQKKGCAKTLDEIRACVDGVLEDYKRPVYYEWVDKIPVTASGKKQRLLLKS